MTARDVDSSTDARPFSDAALRADIRMLGNLLGETLVRQVGPELLEVVERIRALTKQLRSPEEAEGDDIEPAGTLDAWLAELDVDTTINVVRAFTTFFYLANLAERSRRRDEAGVRASRMRGSVSAAALWGPHRCIPGRGDSWN